MALMSEAEWEEQTLDHFAELSWQVLHGDQVAPGSDGGRTRWDELLIRPRLLEALRNLNPGIPPEHLQQAVAEIASPTSQDALTENHRIHEYLTRGFPLTFTDAEGVERSERLRLLGNQPESNEWLAVNQVTYRSGVALDQVHRRFDIVLYVNGMPLAIVELKGAGAASGSVAAAHAQLATYVREMPSAFAFAVLTVASDGLDAKYGTPFTPLNHFAPWNVDDDGHPLKTPRTGAEIGGDVVTALDDLIDGLFNQERFLQLVRGFTAFDRTDEGLTKRIAKPHQYFAVSKAVGTTIEAMRSDGRAGVVWHTQGSGKSMEMELYANLIARRSEFKNPTIIVVTDRTELDTQLFQAFARSELLPEEPKQIASREELRRELSERGTGGILFTTLQKFGLTDAESAAGLKHPLLSDRRNIVVIVDEAHRSHYDTLDGYAAYLREALPRASFIAFTGTPISFADRNTQDTFGDYIDVYDLTRAVEDNATVPVYFEPRLIKAAVAAGVDPREIDQEADEVTLGLDDVERRRIEQQVAVVNAVYGAPERIEQLADDLLAHWRARRDAMLPFLGDPSGEPNLAPGKAMIVCGTREIAAKLYDAIVAREPSWHADALDQGKVKVVYSGTPSDPELIGRHVRRPSQNDAIKKRLRDPNDEIELVIVKDMMLTGFDAPPLHTMYLDRPLKGALLMQALARVNRTFRAKPEGLLVAYAPVTQNLADALHEYASTTDQQELPVGRDATKEVGIVRELLAQLEPLLAGSDWRERLASGHPRAKLNAVAAATGWLRKPREVAEGEPTYAEQFRELSGQLSRAWALTTTGGELVDVRDDVRFYDEVRVWMAKFDAEERRASGQPVPEEVGRMLGALLARSTEIGDVIDIYTEIGLERLSLQELTPQYAERLARESDSHLAIEILRAQLLAGVTRATHGNNARSKAFSERIAELMNKYTNQQLTAAEVMAELVAMSQEISREPQRGAAFSPPLRPDELAFYDSVAANQSALDLQGSDVLAQIARELVEVMRRDVRTDWTVRDDVRAKLRSSIKRLLIKYDYPPDQQPEAIAQVMEQMESMAPRYASRREADY